MTSTSMLIEGALGAMGAAIGTVAGLPAGPGAVAASPALAIAGAAGGAALGTIASKGVSWVATQIGSTTPDDVYITLNDQKVWPLDSSSTK